MRSGQTALVVTFWVVCLTTPSPGQFETRGTSPVASLSFSIVLGDFNHDGKLDMAAPSFSTEQVAVFLGNGNGTFQPPVYYSVGFEPSSVAIADFNHDGNLDLAVANAGAASNSVSILLGNGDGTFRAAPNAMLDASPTFVAVGDFNGDHIPDLIAVDYPYISVLLGNGDGTFQPPIDTYFAPTPVIGIGDFNRDGKLDVAAALQSGGTSTVTILLGNGDGTFQVGASYSIYDAPNWVAVGDFRSVGILDLAIGYYLGGGVSVLLGNGDGTFQPKVEYPTPGTSSYLATGDLNGDGNLDIVAAGSTDGYATVLLGNGDGTFQPGVSYVVSTGSSGYIVVGDLNGDKKPDLAVVGTPSDIFVLLNTGVVSFSPTSPLSFNPQLLGTTSPPHTVTLTNTGTTTLSITSISTKNPFLLGNGTTCGTSVAPGTKCTLSVVFQPTVMGLKTGLLVLNDSASTKPQVIELSGTGTTLTVSPSQLNFGSQKVGTKSPPKNVTVTNTGSTVVSVSGVSFTGSDPQDFVETNTCGTQINPGASCTISVRFDPILKGPRSAVVVINGPSGVEWQGVQLTGTGT
jgi:hypothetical protein